MASPWFEFPDTPRSGGDAQSASKVRFRLFCFPYAGGGASIFRSWADWLPPEVEVVGNPASRTRDAARRTVDALHGAAH